MLNVLNLPYWKKRPQKKSVDYQLPDDMALSGWTLPKGTVVKLKETQNFGWIILQSGTKDKTGNVTPRRIFRF